MKFPLTVTSSRPWDKNGLAPGEFDTPRTLATDSRRRLFVGDRQNNRIQIFDQDGNFSVSVPKLDISRVRISADSRH